MKKIRVAFFADTLQENIDGAVRTMYQIINRIPSDRFEFFFILGQKPARELNFKCIEIPSIVLPFNRDYRMAISTFSKARLNLELAEFDPEVIHIATPSLLGSFAVKYAETHNLKSVSIYHTHFLSYVDYYLKDFPILIDSSKKLLISHMQSFYNTCDIVFVPSQNMIEELSSIGILANKMLLWKRGLDSSLFNPEKRLINLFGDDSNRPMFNVLFASRLVWEKNLATLIGIYQSSIKQNLPYNFIIAGDGSARSVLEKSMPEAEFLGELDQAELATVYASADVFLFPSVSETYGNVVAEAMASGLPCVIADGGGTKDFVSHYETGLVCTANECQSYIDAIELIRNNDKLCSRIIANALSQSKNLSWDKLVENYFVNLEALVKQSSVCAA